MTIFAILRKIYLDPRHAFSEDSLEEGFEESIVWFLGLSFLIALWFAGLENGHFPGVQAIVRASVGELFNIIELALEIWIIQAVLKKRGFKVPFEAFIAGMVWIAIAWMPLGFLLGWFLPVLWNNLLHLAFLVLIQSQCVHALTKLSLNGSVKLCLFAAVAVFLLMTVVQTFLASLL